jgi:hypothetical protein
MTSSLTRNYQACFLSLNPKVLTGISAAIESQITKIVPVQVQKIETMDEVASGTWNLLIVDAQILGDNELSLWIDKLHERMKKNSAVWTPALILSRCTIGASLRILEQMIAFNWYFDIVNPDHLESIPLRIANLIRIHDHLGELNQYRQLLENLQQRVEVMENQALKLNPHKASHD